MIIGAICPFFEGNNMKNEDIIRTALIEKGLDYMILGRDIATASEWKRRGYKIKDTEAPILKVRIWKPIKERGMILVNAHLYDVTQIELG